MEQVLTKLGNGISTHKNIAELDTIKGITSDISYIKSIIENSGKSIVGQTISGNQPYAFVCFQNCSFDGYTGDIKNCDFQGDTVIQNNNNIQLHDISCSGLFKVVGQDNTIVIHPSVRYNKEFSLNFLSFNNTNNIKVPSNLEDPNGFNVTRFTDDIVLPSTTTIKVACILNISGAKEKIRTNTINVVQYAIQRLKNYGSTQDVEYYDIGLMSNTEKTNLMQSLVDSGIKYIIHYGNSSDLVLWDNLVASNGWNSTGPYLLAASSTAVAKFRNVIRITPNDTVMIESITLFMFNMEWKNSETYMFIPNTIYGNSIINLLQKKNDVSDPFIYSTYTSDSFFNGNVTLDTSQYSQYKNIILFGNGDYLDIYKQLKVLPEVNFLFVESNYASSLLDYIDVGDYPRCYFIGYAGEGGSVSNLKATSFYSNFTTQQDIFDINIYDLIILCGIMTLLENTLSIQDIITSFNGVTGKFNIQNGDRSNGAFTVNQIITQPFSDSLSPIPLFREIYRIGISSYNSNATDIFVTMRSTTKLQVSKTTFRSTGDENITYVFNRIAIIGYTGFTTKILDNTLPYVNVFPLETVLFENETKFGVIPYTYSNDQSFQIQIFNKTTTNYVIN